MCFDHERVMNYLIIVHWLYIKILNAISIILDVAIIRKSSPVNMWHVSGQTDMLFCKVFITNS